VAKKFVFDLHKINVIHEIRYKNFSYRILYFMFCTIHTHHLYSVNKLLGMLRCNKILLR